MTDKSKGKSKPTTTKTIHVNIKEFPIHKIRLKTKNVVIGKPGSGKSFLLDDLAYNVKHRIPVAAAYSGTESTNGAWARRLPPLFVFDGFNEKAAKYAVLRSKLTTKLKEMQNMSHPGGLFIWDDCMESPTDFTKKIIVAVFKNGRQWEDVMFLIASQYCLDLKPNIRSCIDYTFILKTSKKDDRQKIYKNYASSFPDFETFEAVLDDITNNYGALVIDNTSSSTKFEDTVFYYKAKGHGMWKFGCNEYKNHSKIRYDPSYIPPLDI
jgi:hypothetical protein